MHVTLLPLSLIGTHIAWIARSSRSPALQVFDLVEAVHEEVQLVLVGEDEEGECSVVVVQDLGEDQIAVFVGG